MATMPTPPDDPARSGLNRRSVLRGGSLAAGVAGAAALSSALPASALADSVGQGGVAAAGTRAGAAPVVQGTSVNYAPALLGTDQPRPVLHWWLRQLGTPPDGYQVQVASSAALLLRGNADVWDSGIVGGAAALDVRYGGPKLLPRKRYHWRVRARSAGRLGPWSSASWFETGLLDEGWAGAQWIGNEPAPAEDRNLDGANWIWTPGSTANGGPSGTYHLRGSLTLPAGTTVTSAYLVLTADDYYTAYLNGQPILSSPDVTDGWRTAETVDLTEQARAAVGASLTVAAEVTNGTGPSINPGGLLGKLVVRTATGQLLLVTDAGWRITQNAPSGWQQPGFDDSAWDAAQPLAPYGQGPWGSSVRIEVPTRPAPLLRKSFQTTAGKRIAAARLYLAAGGYAVCWINGKRVGDHVLDPGFTAYQRTVQYVVHDVTGLVSAGSNSIGAELGRGFYGLVTPPNAWNWDSAVWHGEPRLLARLEISYTDGSGTSIVSDPSWRISDGPVVFESMYAGETYDARLRPDGWQHNEFDDSDWSAATVLDAPAGTLVAQECEPIRVVETLPPQTIRSPRAGVWVVDFGRTVAGWTRLRMTLPRGTEVSVVHGETLAADGTVQARNGNAAGRCQQSSYLAAGTGQVEEWEPQFTYYGFRYAQLTGLPAGLTPTEQNIQLRVVYSDIDDAGTFSTDDALYQRFEAMMRRTIHNNLHALPTDTPMYEKNGWTGDAQVGVPTMAQQLAMPRLLGKWLRDLADSQVDSGQLPVIVPSGGWGYRELAPAPEWTTVYPFLLREMHRWYGDTALLAEHLPVVTRYLDWELGRLQDGLAVTALGDYLSPGTGGNPPEDTRLTATAYLIRALRSTAESAEITGADGAAALAARYRAAAEALRGRLNEEFLDRTAGHYRTSKDPGYRQTNNVIPMAFDLVPDEFVTPVFESLVADISARGNHLNTGCLGTSELLPLLTRYGRADLAAAVARQRSYPSWGYWVDNGADTMWEFWQLPGRSRDHYFQGTVVQWLLQNVAGLRPLADGWRRFLVRPDARVGLGNAQHALTTVRGEVAAGWQQQGARLTLRVTVPLGCTAEVHVPARAAGDVQAVSELPATSSEPVLLDGFVRITVGGGRWTFTSRSAE